MIDAAIYARDQQQNITTRPSRSFKQSGIVRIRNKSGSDVEQFGVLGIDSPCLDPDTNFPAFAAEILLDCVTPSSDHNGAFVVTLEPIANDKMGLAVIDGMSIARVEMSNDDDDFAEAKPGSLAELISDSESGSARILWAGPTDGDGIALCIIKIGLAGSAGGSGVKFAVITSKAGTTPPFIYSATESNFDPTGGGTWSAVGGGDVISGNMYNVEEYGSGGQYVNPLSVGDPVVYVRAPGGANAFLCWRSHYRGTY